MNYINILRAAYFGLGLLEAKFLFFSNDKSDLPLLKEEERKKVQEIADRMGITEPLTIYDCQSRIPAAKRINGKACILCHPRNMFVNAHELAHIKNNDVTKNLHFEIALMALMFFGALSKKNCLLASALGLPLACYIQHCKRQAEEKADRLAAEQISPSELSKGIDYFKERLAINRYNYKHNFIARFNYKSDGEKNFYYHYFIDCHPYYTDRIKYLEELHRKRSEKTGFSIAINDNNRTNKIDVSIEVCNQIRTKIRSSGSGSILLNTENIDLDLNAGKITVKTGHEFEDVINTYKLLPKITSQLEESFSSSVTIQKGLNLLFDYILENNEYLIIELDCPESLEDIPNEYKAFKDHPEFNAYSEITYRKVEKSTFVILKKPPKDIE